MSLRILVGNRVMKLTDTGPLPTEPLATNPWNYLLAQQLNNPGLKPAELQQRMLVVFPTLLPAAAEVIIQQLEPLLS